MNEITINAFMDELEKIAYGPKEHGILADTASMGLSTNQAPWVNKTFRKGSVDADKGIRGPKMPWSDPIHSFGASQTSKEIKKAPQRTQSRAVRSIADSIGDRSIKGRILSGARAHRGMKQVGLANHQQMDNFAHNKAPEELGSQSLARKVTPKSGYGGQIAAAREHTAAGLKGSKVNPGSHLDNLDTKNRKTSREAVSAAGDQGRQVRRQVERNLMARRGMTQQQAAAEAERFFSKTHSPNAASRALGEASRASRYVKGEVRRAAGTPVRLLRRVIRR